MSRATRRLWAHSHFAEDGRICAIATRTQFLYSRSLSSTPRRTDDQDRRVDSPPTSSTSASTPKPTHTLSVLADLFAPNESQRTRPDPFLDSSRLSSIETEPLPKDERYAEPHHFHVFSTKHNTHITLTNPNRDPILSYSAGNIGFRKAARKHYDSAFQLASYVMGRIQEQGINTQIKKLEVCLRGFGAGREAVTKALLGSEGRFLKGKVVKVSDSTRIKFGGTRSRKPRRLG